MRALSKHRVHLAFCCDRRRGRELARSCADQNESGIGLGGVD